MIVSEVETGFDGTAVPPGANPPSGDFTHENKKKQNKTALVKKLKIEIIELRTILKSLASRTPM